MALPSTSTYIHHHGITRSDYEQLYKTLYKDHEMLKSEYIKIQEKLLTIKQNDCKDINDSLRFNIKSLQANLRTTNSMLKQTQKRMFEDIKTLSETKTKLIEPTAKKNLVSTFSPNQLNLMLKKKKKKLIGQRRTFSRRST